MNKSLDLSSCSWESPITILISCYRCCIAIYGALYCKLYIDIIGKYCTVYTAVILPISHQSLLCIYNTVYILFILFLTNYRIFLCTHFYYDASKNYLKMKSIGILLFLNSVFRKRTLVNFYFSIIATTYSWSSVYNLYSVLCIRYLIINITYGNNEACPCSHSNKIQNQFSSFKIWAVKRVLIEIEPWSPPLASSAAIFFTLMVQIRNRCNFH